MVVKLNSIMIYLGYINMKLIIDGYNKSIHKKDNQIVIHENSEIIDSIKGTQNTQTDEMVSSNQYWNRR